jgi:hypothetical protein
MVVVVGMIVSQITVGSAQQTFPPKPANPITRATADKFTVRDGIGIGSVAAGQTLEDAIAAWGQPDDRDASDEDGVVLYTWYQHPGEILVIIRDGRISMMFAEKSQLFHTQSGLQVNQSTTSDVRARLGAPEETKVRSGGDLTWYYWSRGINVTFAGGVIKYVSVYNPV